MCPLGLRAALLPDTKDRFYASFTYPYFHPGISVVGVCRLGDPHGRQFRHRVQLVERSRAGRYLGQHAVVQHRPSGRGCLVAFVALYVAHARGLHFAGIRQRDYPLYFRLVPVGLAVIAMLFASASIDFWTVMRFFGSRGLDRSSRRLAGPRFFARAAVLSVRSAFLFGPAWVCVCGWRFFPPCCSGSPLVDGSYSSASATAA